MLSSASQSSNGPRATRPTLRVAFIVGKFPVLSEPFIVDQAADLIERGVHLEIFAFEVGSQEHVSRRFVSAGLRARTNYLQPPQSRARRIAGTLSRFARVLFRQPRALTGIFGRVLRGESSWSAQLYTLAPFAGRRFDVLHCHFGTVGVQFLPIRAALPIASPVVTTFYGYDASMVFRTQPAGFYDRLKREGALFYAMSENMRQRLLAHGFPAARVVVHPVGVDLTSHPFVERTCPPDQPVRILAVGRLVEKKGLDVLLDALALVQNKTRRVFECVIVGRGPLESALREQCRRRKLDDVVRFAGSLSVEQLTQQLPQMHLLVAPSRTAADGDME